MTRNACLGDILSIVRFLLVLMLLFNLELVMKKIIYTMLAAAAIGFTSCNDSFMERYPDTSLTEQTVFSNYNTFKTYAWGLYGVFTNTNILRIPGTNGAYASAHPIQAIFMQVI